MSNEFPREISFDEIKIGDTIEASYKTLDVVRSSQGVVATKDHKELCTKEGVFMGKDLPSYTFLLLGREVHIIDKLKEGSIISLTWEDAAGDSAVVLFKNPDGWIEVSPYQAKNRIFAAGYTRVGWIKQNWDDPSVTGLLILEG